MAVKVNSGDLKHFIIILQPTETRDDEGGRQLSFTTLLSTRAKVQNISNSRVSDPIALLDTKEFFVRYTSNRILSANHVIVYEGNAYTVNGVERVDEDKRFIKLTAKSKGNAISYLTGGSNIAKIEYTASGGEGSLTYAELIGKGILIIARSGIAFEVINSGDPTSRQVLFDNTTGLLTFGASLNTDEWVLILYNNG